MISDASDWPALEKQLKKLVKMKKALGNQLPGSRKAEIIAHLNFLLGMHWLLLRAQCKLIRTFRPLLDHKGR